MTIDVHMEGLSLEDFNNSEEQVAEIYTNLCQACMELLVMKQITSKIQLKRTKKTKIQSFAKSFASNTVVNNNSKKPISCIDNQIVSLYPFDN